MNTVCNSYATWSEAFLYTTASVESRGSFPLVISTIITEVQIWTSASYFVYNDEITLYFP